MNVNEEVKSKCLRELTLSSVLENVVHQVVVKINLGILGISVSKSVLFDY